MLRSFWSNYLTLVQLFDDLAHLIDHRLLNTNKTMYTNFNSCNWSKSCVTVISSKYLLSIEFCVIKTHILHDFR